MTKARGSQGKQGKGKGCFMTKEEASKRYRIPLEILDAYERWGCAAR